MSLTVAVQMDPLERLNPERDATLFLSGEAHRRGHVLYSYQPKDLYLDEGRVMAHTTRLLWDAKAEKWRNAEPRKLDLAEEADVVMMRQDPPFDMSYITATYLLELLRGRTLVVNDPAYVRNHPEKLFPLEFPEFIPATQISAVAEELRAFHRRHGEMVLKPLYSYGGRGVFKIGRAGENLDALLEMLLEPGLPIIAQEFLPDVTHAERRIVLLDGEPLGIFGRIPQGSEIRSNMRVGGEMQAVDFTPGQRALCAAIGPVLRDRGMIFTGLDMIGDKLIEINITSPTGLRGLVELYDIRAYERFWEVVEARLVR